MSSALRYVVMVNERGWPKCNKVNVKRQQTRCSTYIPKTALPNVNGMQKKYMP